jgi:hypothetical protein
MIEMLSPEPSFQAAVPANIYRLEGDALKQWWQTSRGTGVNKYRNFALIGGFQFLFFLPVFAALTWQIYPKVMLEQVPVMLAAWTVMFIMFVLMCRRHLKTILAVQLTEEGLLLQSLCFLKRRIFWSEVRDFFPLQNNDYLLVGKDGEQFILSSELQNKDELFEKIRNKLGNPAPAFDCNFRVSNECIDSMFFHIGGLSVAMIFLVKQTLLAGHALDLYQLIFLAVICMVVAFSVWIHFSKLAHLVRCSASSLFLSTGRSSCTIAADQFVGVSKIGAYLLLKTRNNWFLLAPAAFTVEQQRQLQRKMQQLESNRSASNRLIS